MPKNLQFISKVLSVLSSNHKSPVSDNYIMPSGYSKIIAEFGTAFSAVLSLLGEWFLIL